MRRSKNIGIIYIELNKMGDKGWIAPRLTDGLCNRLFQIAAATHYSKKTGLPIVFYIPRVQPSVHSDCSVLFQLFPTIPRVISVPNFTVLKEDGPKFLSYTQFDIQPKCGSHFVMEGYFQCAKYLENIELVPEFENVIEKERLKDLTLPSEADNYMWIHIRLGDYKVLPHHQCTTEAYWIKALMYVPKGCVVLVFSDEMKAAKEFLEGLGIEDVCFVYSDDLSPIETLYVMSQCGGGCIGSNSSFSWWGMYFSKARKAGKDCILPSKWHKHIADCSGVYGSWHTIVEV